MRFADAAADLPAWNPVFVSRVAERTDQEREVDFCLPMSPIDE